MENSRIRSKHGHIGPSSTPGSLLSPLTGITCPQPSATMSDPAPELEWNDWLGPDLDLESGLMHMQGPPLHAGMTQERSSPQERPVDQTRLQASATQNTPRFLHPTDHSQETEHDGADSRGIRYDMVWRLTKNGRSVFVDTERMVKVRPSVHWREILKTKIALGRDDKGLDDSRATLIDTNVVVLKTGRPANRIPRRFKGLDVDWTLTEQDMEAWAHQLKPDQMLKIELSVNLDTKPRTLTGTKNQAGRPSATKRGLADRDEVIRMEQQASGQLPAWPANIESLRCFEASCDNQGKYCRADRTGQHIPLQHRDFRDLIQRGAGSPRDGPGAKPQLRKAGDTNNRKRKVSALEISSSCSPRSVRGKTPSSQGSMPSPVSRSSRSGISRLPTMEITKLLGLDGQDPVKVLRQYFAWLLRQSDDETWQEGNRKAEAAAMRMNLDVVQIGFKVDHECFVKADVPLGAALRTKDLVVVWAKERQRLQDTVVSV